MATGRESFFEDMLRALKSHFGSAAKSYWVHDEVLCPCCRTREVDLMDYKGSKALSINAFMYREKGVLIGYLLCGKCAKKIMDQSSGNQAEMHTSIEKNLADAYLRYMNSLDA